MRYRAQSKRGNRFSFDKKEIFINRDDVCYIVEITGIYDTGYDPPACCDHDHPAFSDPGADAELSIILAVVRGYDEVDPENLPAHLLDIGQPFDLTDEEEEHVLSQLNLGEDLEEDYENYEYEE